MKAIIIASLAVLALTTATYTDKYDNVDYKQILLNCRLLKLYLDCILDETPSPKCPQEALELRSKIKDALQSDCAECTEKQKEGIKFTLAVLYNAYPEIWNTLSQKFDSDGTYMNKYKDQAEESKSRDYSEYKNCDPKTGKEIS